MLIGGADEIDIRRDDRLLGLHHLDVVGHAGSESVAGLSERFVREFFVALRNRDLVRGGLQIEKRGAHLLIDLTAQVAEIVLSLPQSGIRLFDVGADASAVKNCEIEGAGHVPHVVRGTDVHAGGAEIRA